MFVNVGYAHLKEHWRGLPPGTLSGSVPSFIPRFDAPRLCIGAWDHKWPVVLDANELSKIFSSEYEENLNYQHDPFEGPIYHAANALANRHRTFFDLLRGDMPKLIADGTSMATFSSSSIDSLQWNRPDRRIDIVRGDFWCITDDRPMMTGVKLRLGHAARSKAALKQPGRSGRPPTYDWPALSEKIRRHVAKNGSFESLIDLVNWCVENVSLKSGKKRPRGDGPDTKTVKAAISMYNLDKVAGLTLGD